MTPLREAAQQALEFVTSERWGTTPYMDVRVYEDAAKLRDALRAALAQEQAEPMTPADRIEAEADRRGRALAAEMRAALTQEPQTTHSAECWRWHHACAVAMIEREQAREIAAQALNARERELLQGLIERELWHATTCDAILARPDGNHRMASAQKGWDMERVALLRKLGGL